MSVHLLCESVSSSTLATQLKSPVRMTCPLCGRKEGSIERNWARGWSCEPLTPNPRPEEPPGHSECATLS